MGLPHRNGKLWKGALAMSHSGVHAVLWQCGPPLTLTVHRNMSWEGFKDLHQPKNSPS